MYILLSCDQKHWYIGSTENLQKRLYSHNNGYTFSTKPYRPWKIMYFENFESRSEATKREMFLKSPSGYKEYLSIKDKILNGGVA